MFFILIFFVVDLINLKFCFFSSKVLSKQILIDYLSTYSMLIFSHVAYHIFQESLYLCIKSLSLPTPISLKSISTKRFIWCGEGKWHLFLLLIAVAKMSTRPRAKRRRHWLQKLKKRNHQILFIKYFKV